MTDQLPEWVIKAAKMPVAFAQVREDPHVDLGTVKRIGRSGLSGIMIASGGCTAAVLATSGCFSDLHLVDVNPAQIALARLKLHLVRYEPLERRLQLLGHAPMQDRVAALAHVLDAVDEPTDALGSIETVASLGPDHAGRYELLFSELRNAMGSLTSAWPAILNGPNPADAVAPGTSNGRQFDDAFDRVMALPNLVALFGEAATQNGVLPFARHFADRTRAALANGRSAQNPFLWQLLVGRFSPTFEYAWLSLSRGLPQPPIIWHRTSMASALSAFDRRFDFVHLSNILDWLAPHEAAETLRLAHRALRPDGRVIIRQLNSSLDLPLLAPEFDWESAECMSSVLERDDSFFYRAIHEGRRR